MDDIFEILIYVVVFGFVIVANIRKSRQKAQVQHQPVFEAVDDAPEMLHPREKKPNAEYKTVGQKPMPEAKIQLLNQIKEKKQAASASKSETLQAKSTIQSTEIKGLIKGTDNQKKTIFNVRKAIIFSTIIQRPYN